MFKNTQLESINQIKKDFQELISLKDKQNRIMAEKYKELKEIFDKRPSREEDLENISNLMDELKRNEKIIKNFEGKLEFYKNELDIREENYNGKFNYKPNVGNYDPLKGKEQFNNNSLNRMNSDKKNKLTAVNKLKSLNSLGQLNNQLNSNTGG